MEQLPAWNNRTEYQSLDSSDFNTDCEKVSALIRQIEELSATKTFDATRLQQISKLYEQAVVLYSNLRTYVSCELSLDAKNATAIKLNSRLMQTGSALGAAMTASHLFLSRADDKLLSEYLNS